jgi:hypothetical protein
VKETDNIPYSAWDNFLAVLIMTAWGAVSYPLREAFLKSERLTKQKQDHRKRSKRRKQQAGSGRGS